jgi:hypothetical protein
VGALAGCELDRTDFDRRKLSGLRGSTSVAPRERDLPSGRRPLAPLPPFRSSVEGRGCLDAADRSGLRHAETLDCGKALPFILILQCPPKGRNA